MDHLLTLLARTSQNLEVWQWRRTVQIFLIRIVPAPKARTHAFLCESVKRKCSTKAQRCCSPRVAGTSLKRRARQNRSHQGRCSPYGLETHRIVLALRLKLLHGLQVLCPHSVLARADAATAVVP